MEIKFDEGKILKEVLEFDGDIHNKIKEKITTRLVDRLVDEIEKEFINKRWNGTDEIWKEVLEKVREEQEKCTKDVLKEFYDTYKYNKKDTVILKKLGEFLSEN